MNGSVLSPWANPAADRARSCTLAGAMLLQGVPRVARWDQYIIEYMDQGQYIGWARPVSLLVPLKAPRAKPIGTRLIIFSLESTWPRNPERQ